MKGKWFAFWIWTIVVVACLALVGTLLTRDWVYTGSKVEFTVSARTLEIEAESVTIEAASDVFFVFRKESGETVTGTPDQKPLGWSSDKYFTFKPAEVPGGRWLCEKGSASFSVTAREVITVRAVDQTPGATWFVLVVAAACIWFIGLWIGS